MDKKIYIWYGEDEDAQNEPTMKEILQEIQGEKMRIKIFDNQEQKEIGVKTCTKEEYESLEAALYLNENLGVMVKKYAIEVLEEDVEPWASEEAEQIIMKHCDVFNTIKNVVCDGTVSDKTAVEIYKLAVKEINETLKGGE